jgi:hypothetical protein
LNGIRIILRDKMKEKFGLIVALIMIIGTCFTVYFYAESRYALAQELKKTQQRLEYKIISDQLRSVTERIWKIEDRITNTKRPMDETAKEELRQLQEMKITMTDKLKQMESIK